MTSSSQEYKQYISAIDTRVDAKRERKDDRQLLVSYAANGVDGINYQSC